MTFSLAARTPSPAFLTATGFALLAGAPYIARFLRGLDLTLPFSIIATLWALILAGGMAYGVRINLPTPLLKRTALAIFIFMLGAFPLTEKLRPFAMVSLLSLAGWLLLAAGLIRWQRLHPLFDRLTHLLARTQTIPRWIFLWALYTVFVCLTVFLSWYCFKFLPTIIDTISQYVHAKFIALSGQFYIDSHRYRGFFDAGLMINNGKWYSQYQPLHVLLLAIGHVMHMPWLVNPVIGALTLIATYALARRITDEPTARIAALLTLCCPFIVFMSSEYMNHATTLLFTTTMALCYVAMLQTQAYGGREPLLWSFGAGMSMGLIFLARPLTAVCVGVPIMLYSLYLIHKQPRLYFRLFLPALAAGVLCLIFQGWYNLETTGELLLFPYEQHHSTNVPGFDRGHTLLKGLDIAERAWLNMNKLLFEWSVPNTIFVLLACLLPLKDRFLRLLLWIIVSATVLNMINRYHSSLFGPRYLYEISSALVILTAVGLRRMPQLLQEYRVYVPANVVHGITAVLLIATAAVGWSQILPRELRGFSSNYVDGNPGFYFNMMRQATPPALVFISQIENPKRGYKISKYLYVAHTNPPMDDAPVIFAIDRGKRNERLLNFYPNRTAYIERDKKLYLIPKTTVEKK